MFGSGFYLNLCVASCFGTSFKEAGISDLFIFFICVYVVLLMIKLLFVVMILYILDVNVFMFE